MRRWRQALGARRGDDGYTLVIVLGTMSVLMLFLLQTLAFTLRGMEASRNDQDAKSALAAAQAGIQDYLARLTADSNYFVSADPATDPALGPGRSVPGTAGQAATYRYRVLTPVGEIARTGIIELQSTGTSRGVSRTLTAQLQPDGFLKYLYFSDVEVTDPALRTGDIRVTLNGSSYGWDGTDYYYFYARGTDVVDFCSRHYDDGRHVNGHWASESKPVWWVNQRTKERAEYTHPWWVGGVCSNINWAEGDVLDGPLHTNDALLVNGSAVFREELQSSWADTATPAPLAGRRWWGPGMPNKNPAYAAPKVLPTTNIELLDKARTEGCVYSGETRIRFVGSTMKVLSPATTQVDRSACYDTANRNSEQSITPIPPVIYVEAADVCGSSGVGYPRGGEATRRDPLPESQKKLLNTTDYDCHYGTAFVQGAISGQVTVATANDIVVTGNLTYQSDDASTPGEIEGTDVIGLIADNYVWVYHPVWNDAGTFRNLLPTPVTRIDAAILSLRHSFLVQNWDLGERLTTGESTKLSVRGSVIQKFRGPVGTGSSGYLKNYRYDRRLRVLTPPYFLQPASAPWDIKRVTDG